MLHVLETNLATSAFQKSMVKTFVQVSLLPDPKTQQYVTFSGKGKGTLVVGGIPKAQDPDENSCTLADLAVDVAVEEGVVQMRRMRWIWRRARRRVRQRRTSECVSKTVKHVHGASCATHARSCIRSRRLSQGAPFF